MTLRSRGGRGVATASIALAGGGWLGAGGLPGARPWARTTSFDAPQFRAPPISVPSADVDTPGMQPIAASARYETASPGHARAHT